ncbi:hypothetical protein KSF_042300 [Reticulibacter mediterranei]|uniref:Uncharacterized protein n=1 Tax=Reticulibacter mediterranei TaxID=2778369 RepID=A0A8J3INB2_9CHLR|nr:hypothetical protein [Reticulibacter mediterranei]GHO94182.1 hypothetical protein KSF_042300 [Reticulibacter mediterranei]
MENNSQSRTLYLIQIITLVVLVLLLIVQILPFFGIMPPGKSAPHIQTMPKGNVAPPQQPGEASTDTVALFIPPLF